MKHRGRKASYLSFKARRRRKRHPRGRKRNGTCLSTSTAPSHGQREETEMDIDISDILGGDDDQISSGFIQELGRGCSQSRSMIPFIDVSRWLGTTGNVSLAASLPSALSDVCRWCRAKVNQSLEYAKDVVFPSRVYWRELHSTQDQLKTLTEQLQKIQENMQPKDQEDGSHNSSSSSCTCCSCPMHNTSNVSSSSSTNSQATNLAAAEQSTAPASSSQASAAASAMHPPAPPSQITAPPPTASSSAPPPPIPQSLVALPPAPPTALPLPPPPPPPPGIVPPPSQDWRKNLRKKKDGTASSKEQKGSGNSRPVISLTDIKGVQLKKVNKSQEKPAHSRGVRRGPLVSMSDLQNIQLKRPSRQLSDPKEPELTLRTRLSLEALEFRTSLKRVGLPRSPGGTPLRTKPAESGVGLTPIMTRALRRKFKSVNTSPAVSPGSVFSSPEAPTPPGLRL